MLFSFPREALGTLNKSATYNGQQQWKSVFRDARGPADGILADLEVAHQLHCLV